MLGRFAPLDWLRGLMAMSIMVYHLAGRQNAGTPLGKLGVYGVSIFFIISGLSMAIAYDRYIKDLRTSWLFLARRLFRIWPLLWIAVGLVSLTSFLSARPIGARAIALNLTTLFGFVAPAEYINVGAWSIGNEMVYYAFTPALIAAYHFRRALGNTITVATCAIGIVFAFRVLTSSATLVSQWHSYINPFNNLYFYCSGICIYYNQGATVFDRKWNPPLFLLLIALFFIYPASGDQINIVTGANRIAMSLMSVAIVALVFRQPITRPSWLGTRLEQLGIATYGVYLLHPIIMDWLRRGEDVLGVLNAYVFTALVVISTILLATLSFRFVEAPLIRYGKRLTTCASESLASNPK